MKTHRRLWLLVALCWTAVLSGQSPNDDCVNATVVVEGTYLFDNSTAGLDGPTDCDGNMTGDVWFQYTASIDGVVRIETCNSTGLTDTTLIVYDGGSGCPSAGNLGLACDDDSCGASGFNSAVEIPISLGDSLLIQVGGWNGTVGAGTLDISLVEDCGDGVDNDLDGLTDCADPNCAAEPSCAPPMTRQDALDALLSELTVDPDIAVVWSPFVDYGFGPSREGLVPAGSTVEPAVFGSGTLFPGSVEIAPTDSYFFFIDDALGTEFAHPTRFVFVDATQPSPTVANGGILVSDQGWWPVLTPFGGAPTELFQLDTERATDDPVGSGNPEGACSGNPPTVTAASSLLELSDTVPPANNALWALVVCMSGDARHKNNATRADNDLREHYGVHPSNMIRINAVDSDGDGDLDTYGAATEAQFVAAITTLCNQITPECEKLFIRMTGHGSPGKLKFSGSELTRAELKTQFDKIGEKGIQVCLTINACYSGSMLQEDNWGFPAGSVIMTSAAADRPSYGYSYINPNVNESAYTHALSECLRVTGASLLMADLDGDGMMNDLEAEAWVHSQNPCYDWILPPGSIVPGLMVTVKPTDEVVIPRPIPFLRLVFRDPNPQVRVVGQSPCEFNINIRNNSGAPKTCFQIVVEGDVTGGDPAAWLSNAADETGINWGIPMESTTFDPATGNTTITWGDPSVPVADGDFIHFGYIAPEGKQLRRLSHTWTANGVPPGPEDQVPGTDGGVGFSFDGSALDLRLLNRSDSGASLDESVTLTLGYRVSATELPLAQLALGDPVYQALSLNSLGVFVLEPDEALQISISVPPEVVMGGVLILESSLEWALNGNSNHQIEQFHLVDIDPEDCSDGVDNDGDGLVDGADPDCSTVTFVRGDANADGARNIADAVSLLGYLFPGGGAPSVLACFDSGDANDDGTVDISDVIFTLGNLFPGPGGPVGFPMPTAGCGVDPTADSLDCASFPPCP